MPTNHETAIAIIAVAGRYPHARTLDEFWDALRTGRDCVGEVPGDRWDHALYYHEDRSKIGKAHARVGGFLEDVDCFDPLLFEISPSEANLMDPMVRLSLQTVWELLENAGYTRDRLHRLHSGNVGLYLGAMYQQYALLASDPIGTAVTSMSSFSGITSRVSHFFNFQGPSVAVDTMCSSGSVAVHMACESLARRECDVAVAAAVNLTLHPGKYVALSLGKMMSSHPERRSFADGDGFVPSEGVGAVLLKPLRRAIEAKDPILAVIRGTQTNHKGNTNGFYVPSAEAQARLWEANLAKSGVAARTISYLEASAYGSSLADAVEVAGLSQAFGGQTGDKQFCAIGSVKSNLGHGEAVAGMAQLTKVALMLHHRQLAPSIGAEPLNPDIEFERSPFRLQRQLSEWVRPRLEQQGRLIDVPLRAGVSTIAAGGSNVSLILEEYIPAHLAADPSATASTSPRVVVLSAKSEDGLRALCRRVEEHVARHEDQRLEDIAFTLQVGREPQEHRVAVVVQGRDELLQALRYCAAPAGAAEAAEPPVTIYRGRVEGAVAAESAAGVPETMAASLEITASLWCRGERIDWEALSAGEDVRRIRLPNYPFEARHCWVSRGNPAAPQEQPSRAVERVATAGAANRSNIQAAVVAAFAEVSGIEPEHLELGTSLSRYGVDSIRLMHALQKIRATLGIEPDAKSLWGCQTIADVIDRCEARPGMQSGVGPVASPSRARLLQQFPELVAINSAAHGTPVFWIHGGLGGVEAYHSIGEMVPRPFWGIQARGWLTDRVPLQGVHAMAAYYVHIIQSVQPDGPYDLGGYSLGGALAYEVARQLQEMKQRVRSIVMLDTLDTSQLGHLRVGQGLVSTRSAMLQAVNMLLLSKILREPSKIAETLIHRRDVEKTAEGAPFLEQLVRLGRARGLTVTEARLMAHVEQFAKLQRSYDLARFEILPLARPEEVAAYYFRNGSGVFFGVLEPFFLMPEDDVSIDHQCYWGEWKVRLPRLEMFDVDASNHMSFVSEPKVLDTVRQLCDLLYPIGVDADIPARRLEAFRQEAARRHVLPRGVGLMHSNGASTQ